MDTLPKEVLYYTALDLPYSAINSFCRINKRFASICADPKFWIEKIRKLEVEPQKNLGLQELKNVYRLENLKHTARDFPAPEGFWFALANNGFIQWFDLMDAFRYSIDKKLPFFSGLIINHFAKQFPKGNAIDLFGEAVKGNSPITIKLLLEKFPTTDLLSNTNAFSDYKNRTIFQGAVTEKAYAALRVLLEYEEATQSKGHYDEALNQSLSKLVLLEENIPLTLELIEKAPRHAAIAAIERLHGSDNEEVVYALLEKAQPWDDDLLVKAAGNANPLVLNELLNEMDPPKETLALALDWAATLYNLPNIRTLLELGAKPKRSSYQQLRKISENYPELSPLINKVVPPPRKR